MNAIVAVPVADLTACDTEPIARLNHIQGFGFLLAVSKDWIVIRASANLHLHLTVSAGESIGMPIADLIDAQGLHDIRNRVMVLRGNGGVERLYGVALLGDETSFDMALHYVDDMLVIEGERSGVNDRMDAALLVRTMVARLKSKATLAAFHNDCARQVRSLTGFKRVMIYRFDETGAGEVIAESLNGPMESFLGLHYPASDIPVQARALYVRNPFRIMADVNADTFAILPAASGRDPALDLSLAITRAMSPVHIEYLRNMGVVASMSMSIIVDGKLWGLIACHDDEPGAPSFVTRSAGELFAQMYSMTLESRIREAAATLDRNARDRIDEMSKAIGANPTLLGDAVWLHEVMREMIDYDGLAMFVKGRLTTCGSIPPVSELTQLIRMLDGTPANRIFATDRLSAIRPESSAYATQAAGLLAIPISRTSRDHLLLFRRELVENIRWGGDPDTAIKLVDASGRISPRKSFAAFTKLVRGQSLSFSEATLRLAEIIRSALVEVVARLAEDQGEEQRRTTQRQETLIAELNHRVRNILALIRGLINQSGTVGSDVASYVQSLDGRVQALARAHDQITRKNWGPGLLSSLFDDEIAAYVPLQRERFTVVGAAIYLEPEAFSTMALVVHELVTNSSKYGALSDAGRVEVEVMRVIDHGIRIAWRERDGPAVKMPTRRGFGSAIIERTIPFELQGTVEVRYRAHGLEVDLEIPERFVCSDTGPLEADARGRGLAFPKAAPLAVLPLDQMSVLLLEDNMIVALETEDLLRALGARQVWAVATIAAADELLGRYKIDFAVLDINVGNKTSIEFAGRVEARRIPFIFASGYGTNVDLGGRFKATPIVEKPYQSERASRAIAQVLGLRPEATA